MKLPINRPSDPTMGVSWLLMPSETSLDRSGRLNWSSRAANNAEISQPNGHAHADHCDRNSSCHRPVCS